MIAGENPTVDDMKKFYSLDNIGWITKIATDTDKDYDKAYVWGKVVK